MENALELFRRNRFWVMLGAVVLAALALYWALYGGGGTPAVQGDAVFVSQMNEEEARLARILSSIEGAGQVEVMIYQTEQIQPAFSESSPEPAPAQGVIVCAEGAEDIGIRLTLQQAVATALALPVDRIEIYPLAQNDKEGT